MHARRVFGFMRPARLCASLRYERAIDCVPLQRIADLKAFRLVREGSDLETIERAEIADIDLLDDRPRAGNLLVFTRYLLPQRLRLGLRPAGRELQLETAARCGRRQP